MPRGQGVRSGKAFARPCALPTELPGASTAPERDSNPRPRGDNPFSSAREAEICPCEQEGADRGSALPLSYAPTEAGATGIEPVSLS